MLIMPATTRDFHEMAAAVAADFFENGVPLVKGIAERAKSDQLVPEEVRRLTEKANTAAMLQLLKMEGRGKDIFSLARVEDVLALTHPTHEQSDALSEVGGEKKERAAEEKAVSWPQLSKAAELAKQQVFESFFGSSPSGEKIAGDSDRGATLSDLAALKVHYDALLLRKTAAEETMQNGLNRLIQRYEADKGPSLEREMAEACSVLGSRCYPIIQVLIEHFRKKDANLCKEAEYIVDDRSPFIRAVSTVCDAHDDFIRCERLMTASERAMSRCRRELRP